MKATYNKPETEEIEVIMESHLNNTSPMTLNMSTKNASQTTEGYYDSLSRESDWDE